MTWTKVQVLQAGAILTCRETDEGIFICGACTEGVVPPRINGTCDTCEAVVCGVSFQKDLRAAGETLLAAKERKTTQQRWGWECSCGAVNARARWQCRKCNKEKVLKNQGGEDENNA